MVQEENNVREEIALRIWRETLTNKGNIAKWTGLSYEQVCRLVRGVRRLEGCWGDLSSVMDEEQEAFGAFLFRFSSCHKHSFVQAPKVGKIYITSLASRCILGLRAVSAGRGSQADGRHLPQTGWGPAS